MEHVDVIMEEITYNFITNFNMMQWYTVIHTTLSRDCLDHWRKKVLLAIHFYSSKRAEEFGFIITR
jgi:hypothetical protein